MSFKLRDYQQEVVDALIDSEKEKLGTVIVPTRGGKTYIMKAFLDLILSNNTQEKQIVVVVSPRRALNKQLFSDINIEGCETVIFQSDTKIHHVDEKDHTHRADVMIKSEELINELKFNSAKKQLIIVTLKSCSVLFNTLAKAGLRSSLTIFDEAHNLVTKENSKLTDKNSPVLLNSDAIRYFTATAKDATAEDYSMKNLTRYGKILHKISPKRLVAAGHTLPMYVTLAKVRFKKAHVKDGKLTEEGNVHALIDMIKQHEKFCKEKQSGTVPAIILAGSGSKDIDYIDDEGRVKLEKLGYKVFKMLSKYGTGKTDAALAGFRSHKGKKILLQFAMVGEGITIPDCSATVMMRSLSGIPFIQYGSRPCGLEDTEIKHKKYGHVVVMATDGLEGSMLSSEIQDSLENLNADEYDPFVETLMISEESTGEYKPEGSEGLYVDESCSSVDNVDGVSYLDMMIALSKIDKSESISIQEKMLSMGI